ncbi:hypothetical protein CDL15_Pgr024791 [Punica granatum]|uniref:Uncharacterized protein n=1 Tax=Punica granatum TaxID=22663 RepID=A0A218WJV2_PUNGR|nr:hypothetical protein CDL15_Pgr024791 [Punica granatum]
MKVQYYRKMQSRKKEDGKEWVFRGVACRERKRGSREDQVSDGDVRRGLVAAGEGGVRKRGKGGRDRVERERNGYSSLGAGLVYVTDDAGTECLAAHFLIAMQLFDRI